MELIIKRHPITMNAVTHMYGIAAGVILTRSPVPGIGSMLTWEGIKIYIIEDSIIENIPKYIFTDLSLIISHVIFKFKLASYYEGYV